MSLLLWLACTGEVGKPAASAADGLLNQGLLNPFPQAGLMSEGRISIPEGLLPVPEGGTPFDVARLGWRSGFSTVQSSVIDLGVALDPASLNDQLRLGVDGAVQIWDLDTGSQVPCMAELDAWPELAAGEKQALIIRPVAPMTPGHRVAVVLTPAVLLADGSPLTVLAWAEAQARDPHWAELSRSLSTIGVQDVVLAWDFPIGDGTAPLREMVAAQGPAGPWTFTDIDDVDENPDVLPDGLWRRLLGTYTTDSWLIDDQSEELDGVPEPQGSAEAELWVYVPESARGRQDAPVLVFGHGILADPRRYWESDTDESGVIDVANRLGAVVVATTWRGLTTDDLLSAVEVAGDFGRFHELTDRMRQGVLNTLGLIHLVADGGLLDDPAIGAGADTSRIYYYGISLGAIEGSVTLALQDTVEYAVMHVGGAAWSTMLERSSNWPAFEARVAMTLPSAWDRQLLYAASQLYWDAVDPASYVEDLQGRSFVWQEAIGDNQVPNITTELLMRGVGAPLATPEVQLPALIDTVTLPSQGPVWVQFDPELGAPDPVNRPASNTGAHDLPRMWEGTKAQTAGFFESGAEGWVTHYCGAGPCTASATGAP